VVSRWTGIPVDKMMEGEREKLLKMEAELGKRVIGQADAVKAVSTAVRRAAPGCRIRTGPWAASCSSAPPASARPS
jgi:ATP-dependent Clp protease ATP-binding subunit ClpA